MKEKKITIDGCNLGLYEPYFDCSGFPYQYHTPDGINLDRVTTVLNMELGIMFHGDGSAAEKGTAVHKMLQYYNEKTLDIKKMDDFYKPYLESYKKCVAKNNIKFEYGEVRRFHPAFLYAGTIDFVGTINGKLCVIDYKTGGIYKQHLWQISSYERLLLVQDGNPRERLIMYLSEEGEEAKLIKYDDPNHWPQFLTLLMAYRIKLNEGYLKHKK